MQAAAPIDTDALQRHVQTFAYRQRALLSDLSGAPRQAASFEEQLYFGVLGYEHGALDEARAMLMQAVAHGAPASDSAWFYLALTLRRLGHEPLAFEAFVQAIQRGGRLAPAVLEAACSALQLGDEDTSVALFGQFIAMAGDAWAVRQLLTLDQLVPYNRALARSSPRTAGLTATCSLLGAASSALPARVSRTLGTLLDSSCDDLAAGRLALPVNTGLWHEAPLRPRRVMLVFARHINCSEDFVESDVLHHIETSARARGHEVSVFHADRLLYGEGVLPVSVRRIDGQPWRAEGPALAREMARLADAIETFAPDLLLFEANFTPTETSISPAFFAALPSRRHFGLIAVVPDLYDSAPDFSGAWAGAVDRVLGFHSRGRRVETLRAAGQLLFFPSVPFAPNRHAHAPRQHDFVFAGSLQRGRDAVLASVARHVPNHHIVGGDRRATSGMPTVDDFYRLLASGRVTFNTGWLPPPHEPIQTGRTIEAIRARTAVMEESWDAVARNFLPHVHFVPVTHAAQAVAWTQFLARHEGHRQRLVDAALDFVDRHYSPRHFWTMLEAAF